PHRGRPAVAAAGTRRLPRAAADGDAGVKGQAGAGGHERTRARESMRDAVNGEESVRRHPKPLGPLERQVLEILWDHGARSVRQVIDLLPTDPAYTTIA